MSDRCYLVGELLEILKMSRSTFYALQKQGKLPLEELPRLGRVIRYRAEPIDRYLDNQRPPVQVSRYFGGQKAIR